MIKFLCDICGAEAAQPHITSSVKLAKNVPVNDDYVYGCLTIQRMVKPKDEGMKAIPHVAHLCPDHTIVLLECMISKLKEPPPQQPPA